MSKAVPVGAHNPHPSSKPNRRAEKGAGGAPQRVPGPQDLWFLPLGGCGEFGGNLNLYGHDGQWLMIDLGMGFADERLPGVDLIFPDPSFIEAQRERLKGLVITHAHEDHIGAVAHLWRRLGCPIYASPFAAAMLRSRLAEHGLESQAPVTIIPHDQRFRVGLFELEMVDVAHSIPEPSMLVLRTPLGTVVHTGDWKRDAAPVIGVDTDAQRLAEIGAEGVLALIGDSTNAGVPGRSGSEGALGESLKALFPTLPQRIAVACFSSNVGRLQAIAKAAIPAGRDVALVGRSLKRVEEAARSTGYLAELPAFIDAGDVGYLPRDKVVLVCTGSQAEDRSALSRIAQGDHPDIDLEAGDAVIFSARPIPGNEKAIQKLQGQLTKRGIRVITDRDAFVHVSGHPCRDELADLYGWLKPKVAVPVHGEYQHLMDHAALARSCQVSQVIVPENGNIISLLPESAGVVHQVQTGHLALDGKRLVPVGSPAIGGRRRVADTGAAVVVSVLDRKGRVLSPASVTLLGVAEGEDELDLIEAIEDDVADALERLPVHELRDDGAVEKAVRGAARPALSKVTGKRALIEVQVVRV